jgi:hypothetical protein
MGTKFIKDNSEMNNLQINENRKHVLVNFIEQMQIIHKGKDLIHDYNDVIKYVNNSELSEDEKTFALYGIDGMRDVQNLFWHNKHFSYYYN